MGTPDFIEVAPEISLPGFPEDRPRTGFQTKALECSHRSYKITAHGRLQRFHDAPEGGCDHNYHGTFEFYDYVSWDVVYNYFAVFERGQLVRVHERYRCPHDGAECHHACQQQSECFRYTDGMSLTSPVEGFPLPGYSEPHVVSEPDPNTKHCEQHNRAYVKSCPVCVSDESTT